MKSFRLLLAGVCVPLVAFVLASGCSRQPGVPAEVKTPRRPATNEYHGVAVVDEFQWLEKWGDPEVRQWSDAQNKRTRATLDQLPTRRLIESRLQQLFAPASANYFGLDRGGGQLFALKFQPPAQQAVLVTLQSPTNLATEKIVLDPNILGAKGATTIDFYVPSRDGQLVAVSLSENGSEDGTLHVFETATGRKRSDVVPRVQYPTGGGSVAWNAEGTGLFYTRYPHPGEGPVEDLNFLQRVYFHKLGTPAAEDRYEIGKEFPRIAEIDLQTSDDGRYLLASVANGDGGDFAHYLRAPSGEWKQITRFEDQIKRAAFGRNPVYIEAPRDDAIYLLSRDKAPKGKILRLPLAQLDLASAKVVLDQGVTTIVDFRPSAGGLYIIDVAGGPSAVSYYDFFDQKEYDLNLKGPTAVQELLVTQGDEMLLRTVTYTEPYVWSRYDPARDRVKMEPTALRGSSPVDFGDIEVVRVKVKSKDGEKIPLNILQRKGTRLNGDNPALLTGYGGYGISQKPSFDVARRVWFDQGGILGVANLRGGGEYGEAWHKAGSLTNKQNVFDDFAACAEYLVRSNYTKPAKLAIQGGSNGGLLMAATLTQHPDLVRAVVSHVGLYDMLRVELDPNGVFNTTEFGTVKNPEQFKALYSYSPYHHVAEQTAYPAVLLLTGENDGRVNPAHSRKMAARLQAANAAKGPILLRTSAKSGHGAGTGFDEKIAQLADVYAFLCEQLGVEYTVIERGPWSGAITPSSALVKARLVRPGMTARLAISDHPDLTHPKFFGPVRAETNSYNIVAFPLSRLKPDTQYYYALEIDGRLDKGRRGELRTFPPEDREGSFTMAFASCAKTGSTLDTFDRIRENRPLFYLNDGDFHYLNISTNDRGRFRAAYDAVLASPQQADLYRHVPFVYVWDDHDFGGNNSNRKASSHEAARLTYDEYVPHYPLAFGDGDKPISHSFVVGRVKFILTDLRSERDDPKKKEGPAKTMMGAEQKAWFKQQLLDARGQYPLICWVSSVPWLGRPGTNYYRLARTNQFGFIHHTNLVDAAVRTNRTRGGGPPPAPEDDHWSGYTTERREICDFIKSNHISGLAILHGDSHMLAADDGSHSDFSTGGGGLKIPVMCAGPLDQDPSIKGGPYSQGVYRMKKGEGGFGLITVTDRGDVIDVAYSGRNNKNDEKIALKFSVPAGKRLARSP